MHLGCLSLYITREATQSSKIEELKQIWKKRFLDKRTYPLTKGMIGKGTGVLQPE
jgi:hypothetical protein